MTGSSLEALEIRALSTLFRETLVRADTKNAFILNPGEPGFLETLRSISAQTASTPPGPGRKSIAAHANHVLYGIELANRALGGEAGVYESADWSVAWKLERVTDDGWQSLIARFAEQSDELIEKTEAGPEWNEVMLTGSFAIAAHAAYHLGAIRQMLLDLGKR
jgi:hypothetical protein